METDDLIGASYAFIDTKKRICFSLYVENKTDKEIDSYLAAYFNPHMRHSSSVGFEDKWFKACKATDYGFLFRVTECISRGNCLFNYGALYSTSKNARKSTSKSEFTGSTSTSLNCSRSLQNGDFKGEKEYTEFTDTAIAGEISKFLLKGKEVRQIGV